MRRKRRKNYNSKNEQLCWTCQNATGNCSWSACLKPVDGWVVKISGRESVLGTPYKIISCPQYIQD